jgi:hypothetical protein
MSHDAIILCKRFRTPTSLSQYDARNAISGEDAAANFNSVDEYNHLHVWQKRNLLHAQQQQQQWQRHQKQLPLHEKENTSGSTEFVASGNKAKNASEGSDRGSASHASEGSPNRPVRQHRVVNPYQNMHKFSNHDKNTLNRTSFSAAAHHQFGVIKNGTSDLFSRASSGSDSPIQLPAHPRDARRRSRSALKPIAR